MRPNEFIKENGIEKAIELYNSDDWSTVSDIFLHDLKCLIDSHDLVKAVGGLRKAKARASNTFRPVGKNLLQAIADVESCQ